MKTWYNHRSEPYYTFVKNGQKTIEGRLLKGKYAEISAGDHIFVQNDEETESFEVVVVSTRRYTSFSEMLNGECLSKVLPNAKSVAEGVSIYRQFYSVEKERQYGVVAIEVRMATPKTID